MPGHNGFRVGVVLLTWAVFILAVVFSSLAYVGNTVLFPTPNPTNRTYATPVVNGTNVTTIFRPSFYNEYPTEITPAPYVFVVTWIAIYIYLGLFLIYAFTTLLRVSGPGYLYTHPNYLNPAMYESLIVSFVASIIWIFLWSYGHIIASLVFLLIATITAFSALVVASYGLFKNQKLLVAYGHPNEYRLVLLLVVNPLGMFAMWTTIASLINLSTVLVYSAGVTQSAAGSISLVVLTALVVGYSLVDLAFFERYFRFLYTPYIILIWAFAGILTATLDWSTSNSVFILGLILIVCVVFLVKIFLSVCRCLRNPMFNTDQVTIQLPPNPIMPAAAPQMPVYPSLQ